MNPQAEHFSKSMTAKDIIGLKDCKNVFKLHYNNHSGNYEFLHKYDPQQVKV